MKLIVIDSSGTRQGMLNLSKSLCGLAIAGVIGIPLIGGYLGYRLGAGEWALTSNLVGKWQEAFETQQREVDDLRTQTIHSMDASAKLIAQLQARLDRLDALGERLASVGGLDEGEFDFSVPPALGGPESEFTSAQDGPDYVETLADLAERIENRERQIGVLGKLIENKDLRKRSVPTGRPITSGWMSSRYGYRNDPITGKRAWHRGVDFAGKEGSDVVAVADGVVTIAGYRPGYGQLVEINHLGGYTTRYAHHKEVTVKPGDIVRKGDVVALMGTTGRSTGPHVHFEVYKNGRTVDPSSYIRRTSR